MRTEVPVCKRCCFCIPLRYGLLAWGYFKLIITLILLILLILTLYQIIMLYLMYGRGGSLTVIPFIILFFILLAVTDLVLHGVFIAGCHKKNVKLLRAFYMYSTILFILTAILVAICLIIAVYAMTKGAIIGLGPIDLCAFFLNLVIQAYILLLVRSEIIKLDSNNSFRFVNFASDAQCILYMNNPEEKRTENGFVRSENEIGACGANGSCASGNCCKARLNDGRVDV